LSQLLSKATVTSRSFLIKVVQCVRLVHDALKLATPLNNGAIIQTLQVCPTQWRSPASAGWLSGIVDVDRPFVEGPPKQHNRPDLSPSKLARSTLTTQSVSVVADLSAMSDISQDSVVTYEVW